MLLRNIGDIDRRDSNRIFSIRSSEYKTVDAFNPIKADQSPKTGHKMLLFPLFIITACHPPAIFKGIRKEFLSNTPVNSVRPVIEIIRKVLPDKSIPDFTFNNPELLIKATVFVVLRFLCPCCEVVPVKSSDKGGGLKLKSVPHPLVVKTIQFPF
jgi:hypothetical protein